MSNESETRTVELTVEEWQVVTGSLKKLSEVLTAISLDNAEWSVKVEKIRDKIREEYTKG